MVTAEEIAKIPLFAALDPAELEKLSQVAADLSLMPGEYAAPPHSERALFAVLEGRIQAISVTDGVERPVGVRNPGDLFGEVPITLGTVFPVGFRASEPSRVMRIDPADYHALAAAAPQVAVEVGRLAQHRIEGAAGLSGLAAKPPEPKAIVVGHPRDAACAALAALPRPQPDHLPVAHARVP